MEKYVSYSEIVDFNGNEDISLVLDYNRNDNEFTIEGYKNSFTLESAEKLAKEILKFVNSIKKDK